MTIRINDTTALATAFAQTDKVQIFGVGSFVISGTWVGGVTLLKRKQMNNGIAVQDGGDGAAVMTDSTLIKSTGTAFVADELIGMYITNDTDGSIGLITDNTATVVTATLAGGTDNDFDDGDVCSFWQVIDTYTSNQVLTFTETDNGCDFIAVLTTATSGTAHVEISQ